MRCLCFYISEKPRTTPVKSLGTSSELTSPSQAAHFSAFPPAPHPKQWLWCKAAVQKLLGVAKATAVLLVIDKPSLHPSSHPPLWKKKEDLFFRDLPGENILIGLSQGTGTKRAIYRWRISRVIFTPFLSPTTVCTLQEKKKNELVK